MRLHKGAAGYCLAAAASISRRLQARHPEGFSSTNHQDINLQWTPPTKFCPGTPLFLRAQVCLIPFRTFGIDECAILTQGPWYRIFSAGLCKTRRGANARGYRASGAFSGHMCQILPASVCICRSCARPGLLVSSQNAGTPCMDSKTDALTIQSESCLLNSAPSRTGISIVVSGFARQLP